MYFEGRKPVIEFGAKNKPWHWKKHKYLHVHHFLFGYPLMIIAWMLFAPHYDNLAFALCGAASAFWFSEAKELIKQKWGP